MGTLYYDSGGASTNSGSTDQNTADLSGSAATVSGSVVTLDGSPDLSGIVTSGAAQSTIYLADATNSNMKIFWITAADNGAKTVTVSVAPTGITSSVWKIGGRNSDLQTVVNPLRAGDTCIMNNAATISATLNFRRSGDTTSGPARLIGKAGVMPVLTQTGSGAQGISDGGFSWIRVESLEVAQTHGSSGNAVLLDTGSNNTCYNVKVSDSPERGIRLGRFGIAVACEASGCGTVGIQMNAADVKVAGCNIHDCAGTAIDAASNVRFVIMFNIMDTCGGSGFSGASEGDVIWGNTVYRCDSHGISVGCTTAQPLIANNIAMDNGDTGTEYNLRLANGVDMNSFHAWNIANAAGARGGNNFSGFVQSNQVSSSESTSDPSFTDAPNRDFTLGTSSPAKATGYPGALLGGSTGYMDMGAVQRQEAGGSGGGGPLIRGRLTG